MNRVHVSIAKVYNAVLQEKKALDDSRQEGAPNSMSLCQVRTPALQVPLCHGAALRDDALCHSAVVWHAAPCLLDPAGLPASAACMPAYCIKAGPVASSA